MSRDDPADNLAALGVWFDALAPRLRLYARQWHDPATAEDVVQDAFVALMRQRRRPEHVKAWLFRTVRNAAISRLRSRRRRMRREQAVAAEAQAWFESQVGDLIDARTATRQLAALTALEREIVTLRIWGELTFEEVAQIVDQPRTTVFRRYHAALRQMRQALEDDPCPTKNHS